MSTTDGTVFRKADLHIHTPQSICYSDKSVTSGQIVEASLVAGLNVIAVTDHNTFEGIDGVRGIAKKEGLYVFPGVELSLRSGHFLALFEVDSIPAKLRTLLADIGIKQADCGDATIIAEGETEEVLRKVNDMGGMIIAAHIERWPSGFMETNEPRKVKMAIHTSPYVSALEITVAQDKRLWNNGQARGFPRKHACIQSSDAHSPAEVGRRPVFIKMNEVSLPALRSAFIDYENSIVFPDDFALL